MTQLLGLILKSTFEYITKPALRFSLFILFLLASANQSTLYAKEKYNLSICAIIKNETKFLKEWIEYHRLIGVDHFYLYNNNSKDVPAFSLRDYVKNGLVTLNYWPDCLTKADLEKPFIWALSTQTTAFQHAVALKGKETKWMIFLDVEEFLTPIKGENLLTILEQYKNYPGIVLSSDFFDASQKGQLPAKRLVIETVEMIDSPPQVLQKSVEKTIFQPKLCEKYIWPPFRCIFKNDQEPIHLPKQEICINHYINRNKDPLAVRRKSPFDNRFLSDGETKEILQAGFEIEDQKRPIYRFLPELRKKMGY
jgi:hypothetical protein